MAALWGFIDIDDKPFQQGMRRAEGQARSSAARMNRSLGKIDRGFGRMTEPVTQPRRLSALGQKQTSHATSNVRFRG
jgi:hypothetical protein